MSPLFILGLLSIVTFVAGLWVSIDARSRLQHRPHWERLVWAVGTAVPFTFPIFLPMYLLGARSPDASGRWGPGEMIGIALFFGATLPLVAAIAGFGQDPLSLGMLSFFIVLQNAGFVLLAVFGVARRYRLALAELGLRAPNWPRLAVLGLIAGVLMLGVAIVAEQVSVYLIGLFVGHEQALAWAVAEHEQDPMFKLLAGLTGSDVAWMLLLLGVLVPVGEEIYFRGIVYGGLRARWGIGWGLAGSSLFFAIVHQQVVHFLPIFVLAVVLAVLYERTRSLLPPIIVHGTNNVMAVLGSVYGFGI